MSSTSYTLPATNKYPSLRVEEIDRNCLSGSFSVITKAYAVEIGRMVAIKRTHTNIAEEPLFDHGHPTYVPQILYRSDGKETIVVEEWVEGDTLFDIRIRKKLTDFENARITLRLLECLRDLVSYRKVYHADLTPRNVLLVKSKNGASLRIIDFDPWHKITQLGDVETECISGSMPFIPPEHLFGSMRFNSDKAAVYCAGAILHYLKFGYPPYCETLERDTVSRLMFGPNDLPRPMRARVQLRDFHFFSELVSASSQYIESNENLSLELRSMLNPNPRLRAGVERAIEMLRNKIKLEEKNGQR